VPIHRTAIVHEKADISETADIGPYAIIDEHVSIGKNVKVKAHAYICKYTEIGDDTEVHVGAVLGNIPQDIAFKEKETYLKIGKRNVIREYVTVHRGTKEGTSTLIGDDNFLMAASHVGHNCRIGNKVIIANGALLAGYVDVDDFVFISGNVVVHQYCRIGRIAIIGGFSGVNKDVPPYMSVRGPSVVWSINLVGLRRAGFSRQVINEIKKAYGLIYLSGANTEQAIAKISELNPGAEVDHLIEFIRKSKRGICKYRFGEGDSDYFSEKKRR